MAKPPGQSPLSPEAAAAMTVNERLFAAGLLADFDAAAAARNSGTSTPSAGHTAAFPVCGS